MVEVGTDRIRDVGTSFNVIRTVEGTRVAVAEGSIVYNPQAEAVRLVAGQSLRDPGANAPLVLARIDPGSVGAWRHGRLSFEETPLSTVAADLARSTGEIVRVDPKLAGQQFTGTVQLTPDHAALFADVARLLAVEVRREDGGWTLAAQASAAR